MDNVTHLPTTKPVEFLFAYQEPDRVEIEGRVIPNLRGVRAADGTVTLIVDGRFMVDFPEPVARSAAWLLAQALAVGAGYSHIGALSKDQPFAPIATSFSHAPEA